MLMLQFWGPHAWALLFTSALRWLGLLTGHTEQKRSARMEHPALLYTPVFSYNLSQCPELTASHPPTKGLHSSYFFLSATKNKVDMSEQRPWKTMRARTSCKHIHRNYEPNISYQKMKINHDPSDCKGKKYIVNTHFFGMIDC